MPQKYTQKQIVNTALALIEEAQGVSNVNLREIARKLGCAHTNLYNYFPDYESLLREAHHEAFNRMAQEIGHLSRFDHIPTLFRHLMNCFLDFYMAHPGWFRLMWVEKIGDKENAAYNHIVLQCIDIVCSLDASFNYVQVFTALHVTHCYIQGEIALYHSGKSGWKENTALIDSVLPKSLAILNFMLQY